MVTQSIAERISHEIDEVKNHSLDAMVAVSSNDYTNSIYHLKAAERRSTCSYCKQKLSKFIVDVQHLNSICQMGYPTCSDEQNLILENINGFIGKLPKVEEIKRKKAEDSEDNSNSDPFKLINDAVGSIAYGFSEISNSLWKVLLGGGLP